MNAIDLIITATATGFGVALGNLLFEQIKKTIKKHTEKAKQLGEKIGQASTKTL